MDTWYETKQPESIAGIVVCVVLLVASLSARFYAQHSIKHLWELDNILIMVASVCVLSDARSRDLSAKSYPSILGLLSGDDRNMPCGHTLWPRSSRGG